MKKFFAFLACAAIVCSCLSGNQLSEKRVQRIEFPDGIHSVEVSGAISVMTSADALEMKVTGDSLDIENLRYSFSRGTLSLWRERTPKERRLNTGVGCGEISVLIPQPAGLSSVTLSGASCFIAANPLRAKKISFRLSGASALKAEVGTGLLTVKSSGASSARLCGKASAASYDVSGASQISSADAYVLSENVELDVSGASNVNIGCDGVLKGDVSGASSVICYGDAVSRLSVTGASTVKTGR